MLTKQSTTKSPARLQEYVIDDQRESSGSEGPNERAAEIRRLHSEIWEDSLDKAFRIGELLTIQKDELNHGEWLPWIKDNISSISERTIQVYMSIWENREYVLKFKSATTADSPFGIKDAVQAIQDRDRPAVSHDEPPANKDEIRSAEAEIVNSDPAPGLVTDSTGTPKVVVEADTIEPPVHGWEKGSIREQVAAKPVKSTHGVRQPEGKVEPVVDVPQDVTSVTPLTDKDWEKVDRMTEVFAGQIIGQFHRWDYVAVLDHAIKRMREVRRDYRKEDKE